MSSTSITVRRTEDEARPKYPEIAEVPWGRAAVIGDGYLRAGLFDRTIYTSRVSTTLSAPVSEAFEYTSYAFIISSSRK
jgi:hypothetical protein